MKPASVVLMLCLLMLGASSASAQVPLTTDAEEPPQEEVAVEAPSDDALQERIDRVLSRIAAFDEVTAEVADGVAVLSGEVDDATARDDAAALVERFEGVIWVDNRIEVATDVETRIAPAVERLRRFGTRFIAYVPVGILVILLTVLLWRGGSLIARWEAPARRFGWNPLVWGLFRRMARALLVLVGLLLIFDILGVSAMVGALLGTAGVVGIALGFAFQDIAENYLAGVLMSIRQPFTVNDLVRIGEHEGFVVRLTSRELVLLTLEGNHVRLPNASVFKSSIVNFTRNPRRLFHFDLGVGTDEALQDVFEIGKHVLREMPGVLADPEPFVRVMNVGDSSIQMRFHGWVDQSSTDFGKARSEAIRLVKQGLDEAGIDLPDPRYDITVRRDGRARKEAPARRQTEEVDVAPDRKINVQVEEDLARSDEENLLDD